MTKAAPEAFEPAGKDGNALNEVELISESLMNNRGVLRGNNVIKMTPPSPCFKLELGDETRRPPVYSPHRVGKSDAHFHRASPFSSTVVWCPPEH
jgi:hypothetical protein